MPPYGKRVLPDAKEHIASSSPPKGAASHYADSVLARSDPNQSPADAEDLPTTQKRNRPSALQGLRWNAECLEPQKRKQPRRVKSKDSSKQQLFLDFGQKNFGKKECRECGMVYCPGVPDDEAMHKAQHSSIVNGVLFTGWKCERVVKTCQDGIRIVCVRPSDPPNHLRKAEEVKQIAEEELGATGWAESGKRSNQVSYLAISPSKHIVGFLLAEKIMRAYRVVVEADSSSMFPTSKDEVMLLSKEETRAELGFSLVWVHKKHRSQGIGMRLLKAASTSFDGSDPVPLEFCAFSQPTLPGRHLAARFFGTHSFLVYRSVD